MFDRRRDRQTAWRRSSWKIIVVTAVALAWAGVLGVVAMNRSDESTIDFGLGAPPSTTAVTQVGELDELFRGAVTAGTPAPGSDDEPEVERVGESQADRVDDPVSTEPPEPTGPASPPITISPEDFAAILDRQRGEGQPPEAPATTRTGDQPSRPAAPSAESEVAPSPPAPTPAVTSPPPASPREPVPTTTRPPLAGPVPTFTTRRPSGTPTTTIRPATPSPTTTSPPATPPVTTVAPTPAAPPPIVTAPIGAGD